MTWNPGLPYDDLPALPPPGATESAQVLKALIEARAELAGLKAASARLANPTIVINAIPLLEAQSSSAIENIVTTTDELFAADALVGDASPAARETLGYRSALRAGFDELRTRPLTFGTARRVCSALRGHEVAMRTDEVAIANPATKVRVYTPPARADRLAALVRNWEEFINGVGGAAELDPITRMAIAHYQFEAIHPFTDGNGRTGRVLNVLMLCASGLLGQPILYLSGEIVRTKDTYYRRLAEVTESGAWEEWLQYMIGQVTASAVRTMATIDRLVAVEADVTAAVRDTMRGADVDLVRTLVTQPYSRQRDVAAACGITRQTAARRLGALVEAGLLEVVHVGRESVYLNVPMLKALTSLAASAPGARRDG